MSGLIFLIACLLLSYLSVPIFLIIHSEWLRNGSTALQFTFFFLFKKTKSNFEKFGTFYKTTWTLILY